MFDFDKMVDRTGMGNMKEYIAPAKFTEENIPVFSAAEMDFKTAPSVIESVKNMADRGVFGFTIATEDYRSHVKWWLSNVRKWDIEGEWIVPVMGTIFSIATAIRMTMGQEDAMIVQSPVYYRYEQAATRMGLKTVHNNLKIVDGQYEMDFVDLEEKMKNPRNKLMVLCNAHNPIGKVWKRENLERVAELSVKYDVIVVSDEIFGEMAFDGNEVIPYGSIEAGRKNAITVVSLGKAFNFTGVNHANAIIPDESLRERYIARRFADHYGSMGPFEYASVLGAYCEEGLDWFEAAKSYIQGNAHFVKDFLEKEIPQAKLFPIEGSTVCWIDWSFLGMKGQELHEFFEKEALFELETGDVYDETCAAMTRINISTPRVQLEAAFRRAKQAIEKR